jgi:hypothetical protein
MVVMVVVVVATIAGFYTGLLAQLWVVPYFCSYHLIMGGVYSVLDRLESKSIQSGV